MYTLMDAKKQNKDYPDTFLIPTESEIRSLKSGDYVKLFFEESEKTSERMWVKLMSIDCDNFQGILDNEPFNLKTVICGDIVHFNSKHILKTM